MPARRRSRCTGRRSACSIACRKRPNGADSTST
jgi:hypothetical protein